MVTTEGILNHIVSVTGRRKPERERAKAHKLRPAEDKDLVPDADNAAVGIIFGRA